MSNAMALSIPSVWQSAWVPLTPAAGPGTEQAGAMGLRLPALVGPAGGLHDQERAVEAGLADMPVDLADVAAHLRADIGIGDHGRAALELAIFLAELVRGRDEHAVVAGKEPPCARLVGRIWGGI